MEQGRKARRVSGENLRGERCWIKMIYRDRREVEAKTSRPIECSLVVITRGQGGTRQGSLPKPNFLPAICQCLSACQFSTVLPPRLPLQNGVASLSATAQVCNSSRISRLLLEQFLEFFHFESHGGKKKSNSGSVHFSAKGCRPSVKRLPHSKQAISFTQLAIAEDRIEDLLYQL